MRWSLLVVLSACWTQTPVRPVEAPAPTRAVYRPSRSTTTVAQRCAKSVANAIEIGRSELARSGLPEEAIDELQDAIVESCQSTAWSDETIDCVAGIAGIADWNNCASQMTDDQRHDSTKRAVEILQRRNAYGASAPTP
jgi:hypothetical protein